MFGEGSITIPGERVGTLDSAMFALAVLQAVISARYIPSRHCIHVEPAGEYQYKREIHRIDTPRGEATISVQNDAFRGYYKGVDTSPWGYALAIKMPREIAFEMKLANNTWLDHI